MQIGEGADAAIVPADAVELLEPWPLGPGTTIHVAGREVHVAGATPAEVAAKLGIRPEGGGGEGAAPEEEVERFARAINRQLGWCWVGGPGVPARFLVSTWHRGFARLFDDEVEPESELWDGCSPDAKFGPDDIGGARICQDIARWLWSLGYREVVDAPAKEPDPEPPAPSRDEQIALLAEGKRLRFVRDAGAMGERVPEEVDAVVRETGGYYFPQALEPGGMTTFPRFCGEYHVTAELAANSFVEMLSDLGYRFDFVVAGPG